MSEDYKWLVQLAKITSQNAYIPYSKFKVGALAVTPDGKTFPGCNIENASYGLTVCAERVAIFKGVSEGYRVFDKIIVYCDSIHTHFPCGACREVIYEFSGDTKIITANNRGKIETKHITELLPEPFYF